MKTLHYIYRCTLGNRNAWLLLVLNVLFSVFSELKAQEAFYIYRNDGDFN